MSTEMDIFDLDADVVAPFVTLDAWVIGGRHRHHRSRDHFGADSDLYIAIDEPLGQWGAGTPVKYVIADLYDRINRLTSYSHMIRVMYVDAYVLAPSTDSGGLGVTLLDATVAAVGTADFTLRAFVGPGGEFTVDAFVKPEQFFTLYAFVV